MILSGKFTRSLDTWYHNLNRLLQACETRLSRLYLVIAILPIALLVAISCGSNADSGNKEITITKVVTTSNIVEDWVKNVGGDRVETFSLLPAGSDPHVFQPGAQDIARVADANLVFTVGLGLEDRWLDKLVSNVSDPAKIIAVGEVIAPIEFEGGHDEEDSEEKELDHGPLDPHFWWDPIRAKKAVSEIAFRLSNVDPDGKEEYQANAASYGQQLDELDSWIKQQISLIPEARRLLVTSHETFGYLEERYGLHVVSAIFPGVTTDIEPSPQELARLVNTIKELQVPAIFAETITSDRLARRVAEEAEIQIVSTLYTDSLGRSGGEADTYIKMVRATIRVIVEALR